VRLGWLRQFLARKSAPKDAATWTAITLADGSHDIRRAMEDQHSLARDLLGLSDGEGQRWYRGGGRPHPIAAAAATATPGRAAVLSLAVLLAGLEAGTSKNTWRNPTADNLAYLTALQGWGYELSEVEQVALAHHTDQPEPAGLRGDTSEPSTEPGTTPGDSDSDSEDGGVGSGGGQEQSDAESPPAAADGTAA
jgi:ParB family chromosome partitioning protein